MATKPDYEALRLKLEPGCENILGTEAALAYSAAISLKRIADVLAPPNGQDIGSTLFYIEQRLSDAVLR